MMILACFSNAFALRRVEGQTLLTHRESSPGDLSRAAQCARVATSPGIRIEAHHAFQSMQSRFVRVSFALAGERVFFVFLELLPPFVDSDLRKLIIAGRLRLRFPSFDFAKHF